MTLSLRMTQEDSAIVRSYAKTHGITVSEFARQAMFEQIEMEHDREVYDLAIREYSKNPQTYSIEDIERDILQR